VCVDRSGGVLAVVGEAERLPHPRRQQLRHQGLPLAVGECFEDGDVVHHQVGTVEAWLVAAAGEDPGETFAAAGVHADRVVDGFDPAADGALKVNGVASCGVGDVLAVPGRADRADV
jgi:hypothetical protein